MRPSLLRAATLVAAFFVALPFRATAQTASPAAASRARPGSDFPIERFESISQTATYLAAYDQVAWVTTDSVVALIGRDSTLRRDLGPEWFAYQQDSTWHAVYGRYDKAADRYVQVAHYAAAAHEKFRRQPSPADSLMARKYGRALALTRSRLPAVAVQSRVLFNAYVRPTAGGGLEFWYLPAWQQNGWLVYGMEFSYRVDSAGTRITDSSAVVATLRGSPPDKSRELAISNDERELPTVGQAFFALYYGSQFKSLYIRSRDFVSTFMNTDGHRAWIHAVKHGPDSGGG